MFHDEFEKIDNDPSFSNISSEFKQELFKKWRSVYHREKQADQVQSMNYFCRNATSIENIEVFMQNAETEEEFQYGVEVSDLRHFGAITKTSEEREYLDAIADGLVRNLHTFAMNSIFELIKAASQIPNITKTETA